MRIANIAATMAMTVLTPTISRGATPCTTSVPGSYCCLPPQNNNTGLFGTDEIPIVLNTNLVDICTNGSTCTGLPDIEWMVQSALAELHNATGSATRFYFQRYSVAGENPGDQITGAIHVYAGPVIAGSATGVGVDGPVVNGQWTGFGGIAFGVRNVVGGPTLKYTPLNQTGSFKAFKTLFLHELGHVLGQDHFLECPPTGNVFDRGIMRQGGNYASSNLMEPYIRFVKDIYGLRSPTPKMYYSVDGNAFTDLSSALPAAMSDVLNRYFLSNSVGGSEMWAAWRSMAGHVKVALYTGWSWTVFGGFLGLQNGKYPVAIAAKSNSEAAFAGQVHWAQGVGPTSDVKMRKTTTSGVTWLNPTQLNDAATKTDASGVAMTFDPKTNQYIVLWRRAGHPDVIDEDDQNSIIYRTENGTAPRSRSLEQSHMLATPQV